VSQTHRCIAWCLTPSLFVAQACSRLRAGARCVRRRGGSAVGAQRVCRVRHRWLPAHGMLVHRDRVRPAWGPGQRAAPGVSYLDGLDYRRRGGGHLANPCEPRRRLPVPPMPAWRDPRRGAQSLPPDIATRNWLLPLTATTTAPSLCATRRASSGTRCPSIPTRTRSNSTTAAGSPSPAPSSRPASVPRAPSGP